MLPASCAQSPFQTFSALQGLVPQHQLQPADSPPASLLSGPPACSAQHGLPLVSQPAAGSRQQGALKVHSPELPLPTFSAGVISTLDAGGASSADALALDDVDWWLDTFLS